LIGRKASVLSLWLAVFFLTGIASVVNSYRRSSRRRGGPQPPRHSFIPPLYVALFAMVGMIVYPILWGVHPDWRGMLSEVFGAIAVLMAASATALILYDPFALRK
jgi:hypothetical protein